MRTAPTIGLVMALLVVASATLAVDSGRAQSRARRARKTRTGAEGTSPHMLGSGFTFARSDSTASKRGSSRCEARPATGCERIGGLVGIGSSAGTYLVLDLYSQARLPTGFVSHYQWANGGPYYYVAPARVTGLPSSAGREHILRLTRLRPSSTWLVEVDNHVVDHIELPGSSRGLPMPTALLYASNQDGRLNRGLFRFTQVHALAAGGHIDFALFSAAVRSH